MAARLRRESAHLSTCLVLDRVLMLFLTGYPDTERGKVLLQCALPFHFYNPYVKGDTPMPPEMFMGRKNQLADILDNGGGQYYLRRAAAGQDRPCCAGRPTWPTTGGQGRWAVYTDVLCRCDYRESPAQALRPPDGGEFPQAGGRRARELGGAVPTYPGADGPARPAGGALPPPHGRGRRVPGELRGVQLPGRWSASTSSRPPLAGASNTCWPGCTT